MPTMQSTSLLAPPAYTERPRPFSSSSLWHPFLARSPSSRTSSMSRRTSLPPSLSLPPDPTASTSTNTHKPPPPSTPIYYLGLNLAEIHVPYVHYTDSPTSSSQDPPLQLPDDLLIYLYRLARKTATRCKRSYESSGLGGKPKPKPTLLVGPGTPLASPLATPTSPGSPRSSLSSARTDSPYSPASLPAQPAPPAEPAKYKLFTSSPLNTLLVPLSLSPPASDASGSGAGARGQRYSISRAYDSPSLGWESATLHSGPIVGRVESRGPFVSGKSGKGKGKGKGKGSVWYRGAEVALKNCVQVSATEVRFCAKEWHPGTFVWRCNPSSGTFECLVHLPSHPLPTLAASLHPPSPPSPATKVAKSAQDPTLVVQPEFLDCLDLILLTMLVAEQCAP